MKTESKSQEDMERMKNTKNILRGANIDTYFAKHPDDYVALFGESPDKNHKDNVKKAIDIAGRSGDLNMLNRLVESTMPENTPKSVELTVKLNLAYHYGIDLEENKAMGPDSALKPKYPNPTPHNQGSSLNETLGKYGEKLEPTSEDQKTAPDIFNTLQNAIRESY